MTNKIIIFGIGEQAEMADFLFEHDSDCEVAGFTVNKNYLQLPSFRDKPVFPFESIEKEFSPSEYRMFVAIGYSQMNKTRQKTFQEAKKKGYQLASYVSSKAIIWSDFSCGENWLDFRRE